MKKIRLFPCFVLLCTLIFLSACAAFEQVPGNQATIEPDHPMWGTSHPGIVCPHQRDSPNNAGIYPYSLQVEPYLYCHKCGRFVRGRQ